MNALLITDRHEQSNDQNFLPQELQARIQVAKEFSGNPIGLLIIPDNSETLNAPKRQ